MTEHRDEQLRVIVAGMVCVFPLGGVAWDYLQYVIGLARLGHEVVYYENTDQWPYDPEKEAYVPTGDYSAEFLQSFFDTYALDLAIKWHYRHLGATSFGLSDEDFNNFACTADLFINVSGGNAIPTSLSDTCTTVFIDTDPGYNQIVLSEQPGWSKGSKEWSELVRSHGHHFTYAERVNEPDCLMPTVGLDWRRTRMPVVLDLWDQPAPAESTELPWTTVLSWDGFNGPLVYKEIEYRSKSVEFLKILDLPKKFSRPFTIAIGGPEAPTNKIAQSGWNVMPGSATTRTASTYRDFLNRSRGEISSAKQVYVAMRTGWFSTRSACYLAAGRPVVVQDTGFSKVLPTGEGLFSFDTADQAAASIIEVELDHARHSKAALEIAREHFNFDRVLPKLIEEVFAS